MLALGTEANTQIGESKMRETKRPKYEIRVKAEQD